MSFVLKVLLRPTIPCGEGVFMDGDQQEGLWLICNFARHDASKGAPERAR